MIEALIFDFDGIICDTEPIHLHAFREVLAPFDIPIEEQVYYTRYVGLNDRTFLERLGADLNRPFSASQVADLLLRKKNAYLKAIVRGLPLLPGVRELVESAAQRIPLAICSGAHRREIDRLLEYNNLEPYFESIVSADDIPQSKPDPAGFLETFRRLCENWPALDPARCLVVEDSLLGIRAAVAAGMRVVAVSATSRHCAGEIEKFCQAQSLHLRETLEGLSLELFDTVAD